MSTTDVSVLDDNCFEGSHKFLAEELLVPNANKTDCNRLQMMLAEFNQSVTLKYAEPPFIFTNFEDEVGNYSSGFLKAKKDYEVLFKFQKNKYNYYLIVKDPKGKYDVLERRECEYLTERYGYQWVNDKIDSLKEGSTIKKGDYLYHNNSFDDDMNMQYGINLKTAYYCFNNMTLEDAAVISESAAKRLTTFEVNRIRINVNSNDILLNLLGDDLHYKAFPDIGEDIEDQLLCARRRINYKNAIYNLKNLKKIRNGDTLKIAQGKVVDIKIFCNGDVEELANQKYNVQAYKYIKNDINFNKNVYKKLKNIIENKKNINKLTTKLIAFYNDCKMKIDENVKFSYQNNEFNGYMIEFTVLHEQPLAIGSKIAGRYGNKSTISLIKKDDEEIYDNAPKILTIVPDRDMPTVQYGPFKGLKAELCLNPQSVMGRLNPSQNIEQELNFISMHIEKRIEGLDKLDDKITMLLEFIKDVNERQYEVTKEFIDNSSKEDIIGLFNDFKKRGIIPLMQKPFFGNCNLDDLERLYDKYKVDYFKCERIAIPLIIADEYIMLLKHHPKTKFSARSTSFLNLKGLPARSKAYKEFKELYSKAAIRCGNMELLNMSLINNMKAIRTLIDTYANNEVNRQELEVQSLTQNPFNLVGEYSDVPSNTEKILKVFFTSIGFDIEDIFVELTDEELENLTDEDKEKLMDQV